MIYIGECKNGILINQGIILDAIFYRGTQVVLRIKVYKFLIKPNAEYKETLTGRQFWKSNCSQNLCTWQLYNLGEWFNWAFNVIIYFRELDFQNLNLQSKRKNDQFINIKNDQVVLKEIKIWVFANVDCFLSFPSRFTPLKHQNNGIKIVVQKFHLIKIKEFIG